MMEESWLLSNDNCHWLAAIEDFSQVYHRVQTALFYLFSSLLFVICLFLVCCCNFLGVLLLLFSSSSSIVVSVCLNGVAQFYRLISLDFPANNLYDVCCLKEQQEREDKRVNNNKLVREKEKERIRKLFSFFFCCSPWAFVCRLALDPTPWLHSRRLENITPLLFALKSNFEINF